MNQPDDPNNNEYPNDLPFGGPSDFYKYACRSCDFSLWYEDIIVDSFPPTKPGGFPAFKCPECGQPFIFDLAEPILRSYTDRNHSG